MEGVSAPTPTLSFVIPAHNEEASLAELHEKIAAMCVRHDYRAEVIFVDDGSSDRSVAVLEGLCARDPRLRCIQFRRNYGQTAALLAGIRASTGEVVVTLDADLQNDPADIPHLLAKIAEGYDVVSGWRRDRKEGVLRRWPSCIANRLISHVTGVRLRDYGCTLKAYRREVLGDVPLYGEMHRFVPVLAAWHGARVAEIPVQHHSRRYGNAHYGLRRTRKVLLDLLTVKFLHTYVARPMHFFGGIGSWLLIAGLGSGAAAVVLKVLDVRDFVDTPLPLLAALLLTVGFQFVLMGLLAELLIRIYFHQPGHDPYYVARTIGFRS